MRLLIYTDGAARGNPGPAGAGAILRDSDGTVLAEIAEPLGHATNNVAEWTAVLLALEEARRLGATHVDLRMDSQLVARQISGIYRVKHPDLKPIHAAVMDLLRDARRLYRRPRAARAEQGRRSTQQRRHRRTLIEQAFESGTIALPGGGQMVAGASVERPRPRKVRAPQSRLAGNARPP